MTNLSPDKTFCDWSTKEMPLYVNSKIMIGFLNNLDFIPICFKLEGCKSMREIFDIIFNLYD